MEVDLIKKFEDKVIKSDNCWIWGGSKDNHGYGKIMIKGVLYKAHRLSYKLYIGEIPRLKTHHVNCILHRCDNPSCVNPAHLFMGTQSENMKDKANKGRAIGAHKGESHHKAKLTNDDVLNIRLDLRPNPIIGKEYGVNRETVRDIKRGITWRHL